ncbi:MAG: hypothetical protein LKM37_05685 [Bacteroidales bacterium]|jgi:hypothetical protein|nr:hypothetical protein [Bacteroidales bacterium]MCI1733997.1 hypothetical protein [Bacteroidales bacterium]
MRKIFRLFVCSALCLTTVSAFAQNDFTAYTLSKWNPEGTARSVSMGNAFTALGGDLGAIGINPAASGVYRYNEVTFTPSFTTTSIESHFLGNQTKESKTTFGISNAGGIANLNTGRKNYGLVSWDFGLVYNKVNNFNSSTSARGTNNGSSYLGDVAAYAKGINGYSMDINDSQDPYSNYSPSLWPSILAWNTSLLDTLSGAPSTFVPTTMNGSAYGATNQYYKKRTFGNTSETDLNFGFNFSNKFYIGVNMGMMNVWNKVEETYSEDAAGTFTSGFNYFEQYYHQTTSGSGINMKFGFIFTPTNFLRIGAAVSTPTWYYLTDKYYWNMSSGFTGGYSANLGSPQGSYDYKVTTPFKYNVGIAFTFPQGAFSLDYEGTDYSQMRMHERGGDNSGAFRDINDNMDNYYKHADVIRAGLEVNPIENFSVRAGFQYANSGIKSLDIDNYVGSLGLGYNDPSGFFVDVAYMQNMKKTTAIYDAGDLVASYIGNQASAPFKANTWKLLMTFGYRF